MTFSTRKWPVIALAALGLTLATPGAHAAGVPLTANQGCALQFYQTNMTGTLIAKVRPDSGGSYRLTLLRAGQRASVIADLSGVVTGRGRQETELARVQLSQRDFVRLERGQRAPGRFVDSSDLPDMDANLEVFDAAGRRTCIARRVDIFPTGALFAARPAQPSASHSRPNVQQQRAAPPRAASPRAAPARATPSRGSRQPY
jgi:hypothetical protein